MKYQVSSVEIDTVQFKITQDSSPVSVEPKVFDLIVYLIQQRPRTIKREELFEKIWAGRNVTDTTLSNCIKSARKVLGDNGEKQEVIKTIRGRGYQFIAGVVEVSSGIVSTSASANSRVADNTRDSALRNSNNAPESRPGHFQQPTRRLMLVAILLIGVFSWSFLHKSSIQSEVTAQPYILVTPFEVAGPQQQKWQPFADQMTKDVIRNLRKISGLKVVPASSAFTFKTNKNKAHIKEQLPEVRYLLSTTIHMAGESQMQVTPELEDIFTDQLIWHDEYQSQVDDTTFFSIKSQMATAVSDSLKVIILDEEKTTLGDFPTNNLSAYELYVAGQQQRDLLTHQSLLKAVELFSEAIALDPKFEAAHVARADVYRIIMVYFEKPSDVLPKVIDAVAETLKINPKSAEARSSLGLAYVFAWRWQDAWNMLNQARELNPDLALTELGFALYYCGLGDISGVKQSLYTANELDPLNIELADWGNWALAMVGENEAALKWGEEKIRLHPNVGLIYSSASVPASLAGEHEKAIALAKQGVKLDAGISYPLLALAQAYGHAGETDKIAPLLEQVNHFDSYLCDYETAVTYLLLDDLDKTFEHFNKAVSYRSNCLIFTRNDPRLEVIREDTRFDALLTRVGLDDKTVAGYPR